MVNPRTVNLGIIVPLTGADVDTWGEDDVNPNMVSLDGLIGGRQNISVTNVPITLTSPSGFTATPGSGPTQAENKYLAFTGTMTGNVRVTLPLPGHYIIDNQTTGNFVLSFQGATATEVIGAPPGAVFSIFNDGSRVRFVDMGKPGDDEMWNGLTAMPAWVTACTVRPYLLNDGTVYNIADYPALGARFGSTFGGNGITTFAVPDKRGRVSIPYDGTGTRITVAGSGLNGQTLGASIDSQSVTLTASQIPTINSGGNNSISVTSSNEKIALGNGSSVRGDGLTNAGGAWYGPASLNPWTIGAVVSSGNNAIAVVSTNTGGLSHPNVQPSIVAGISVTKT